MDGGDGCAVVWMVTFMLPVFHHGFQTQQQSNEHRGMSISAWESMWGCNWGQGTRRRSQEQFWIIYKMPVPLNCGETKSQDKAKVRNNLKFSEDYKTKSYFLHTFMSISGQQRLFGIILIQGHRLWWQGPGTQGTTEGLFFLPAFHCPKQLPWLWVTSR